MFYKFSGLGIYLCFAACFSLLMSSFRILSMACVARFAKEEISASNSDKAGLRGAPTVL
jgi:hypothetical protein